MKFIQLWSLILMELVSLADLFSANRTSMLSFFVWLHCFLETFVSQSWEEVSLVLKNVTY